MLRFVSYLKVSGFGFNDIFDRWASTNFVTNTDIDTVEHNLRHIIAESSFIVNTTNESSLTESLSRLEK